MVWTCRAQHRLDCRSTQAECGCTEKIWQAKEIMGWSAGAWQKEARYGFCLPTEPFWVERTPSRKTCQKAQPSVEENRALKWLWWWWWNIHKFSQVTILSLFGKHSDLILMHQSFVITAPPPAAPPTGNSGDNDFPSITAMHCGDLLGSWPCSL